MQPTFIRVSHVISREPAMSEVSFARIQGNPKQIRFEIKLATSPPAQQLEWFVAVRNEAGYRH